MLLKLLCHYARLQIINRQLTLIAANNKLSMVFIKHHLSNFCLSLEDILDNSNRLASSGVPNLNRVFSCNINLETFLAETSTADCFIIGILGDERPRILKHGKVASTTDQTTMFGHGSDTLDFVGVGDIECLNTAVIEDVPKLYHAFRIGCDETVQVW